MPRWFIIAAHAIAEGITAASTGDTVLVKYGTYNITSSIDYSGKNIKLASDDGTHNSYETAATDASQCIIDAGNNCRVFYFHNGETSDSVVDGFTIQNGKETYGGGIYCANSSPTIHGSIISNNSTESNGRGGGIYCNNSSPLISNNTIYDNSAGDGGGIQCEESSTPTLTNNLIISNSAARGAAINCWGNSSLTITNNTVADNSASWGAGIRCESSSATVLNTILWNNESGGDSEIWLGSGSTITITYSDIEEGTGESWFGTGCIDADPLFVNAAGGDYHLSPGSPCLGTGTSSGAPSTDKDGVPRPLDNYDMGAYEQYDDGATAVTLSSFTSSASTDDVTLRWRTETELDNAGFAIYRSYTKDGNYTKIAFVPAAEDSEMSNDYEFVDKEVEPGKTP